MWENPYRTWIIMNCLGAEPSGALGMLSWPTLPVPFRNETYTHGTTCWRSKTREVNTWAHESPFMSFLSPFGLYHNPEYLLS